MSQPVTIIIHALYDPTADGGVSRGEAVREVAERFHDLTRGDPAWTLMTVHTRGKPGWVVEQIDGEIVSRQETP